MSGSDSPDANPLQCPLCLTGYDSRKHEAKLLTCHHSFCLTCLHQMANGRSTVKCPTCRKKTPLQEGKGAKGLQTNFYVTQMREVLGSPSQLASSPPTAESPRARSNSEICKKHSGQPLLFFCETCSLPICMNCTVLDHEKAGGHVISDISKVINTFREVLSNKVTNIEGAIERRRAGLQALRVEMGCLETARDAAEEQLGASFERLAAKLEQRRERLVQEVRALHDDRKARIVKQAQVLKAEMKQLNDSLDSVRRLAEDGGGAASVVAAAVSARSIAELDELCLNIDPGEPINGNIRVRDTAVKEAAQAIDSAGSVVAETQLPGILTIDVVAPAVVGRLCSMRATARDRHGESLQSRDFALVIVDPEGDTLQTHFQSGRADPLCVNFRPQVYGEHQVVFNYLQRPLGVATKSFSVQSNDPVQRIGEPGSGHGQLHKPTSVAVCCKGNMYVADTGNKRIQIFNPSGQYNGQFKLGSSKTTTYDVAVCTSRSELLCTKVASDQASGQMVANTVRVFDMAGEKKYQFVLQGATNALFLANVGGGQGVVVSDSSAHTVTIYNREGAPLKTLGTRGAGDAQFEFPAAVSVGVDGVIAVCDTRNHRVQLFDKNGNFRRSIGSEGKGKGQFRSPRGVAIDDAGRVLVADSCSRIQVFEPTGAYVCSIESEGDPIVEPYNMATTADGHVLLADYKACCVKKYKYL